MNENTTFTHNDQVIVGDCLDVLVAMPNQSVDTVIMDPPYPNGMGLFANQLVDGLIGLYLSTKKAKNYVVFFWSPNHAPPPPPIGWWVSCQHVWSKPDARSTTPFEMIYVWSRTYRRLQSKVWTIPILDFRTLRDFSKTHPTQKPVRLLRNLVELYTKEGDLVLDPFAGTGTTAVACKQMGRHYIIIESNAEHAAFATQRLQDKKEQPAPEVTPNEHKSETVEEPAPRPATTEQRPKRRAR